MNWLKKGLQKTHDQLALGLKRLLGGAHQINEDDFEAIEALLLRADLGPGLVFPLIESLRQKGHLEYTGLIAYLEEQIFSFFQKERSVLQKNPTGPTVVLMIGVNGTGKTTTIAKLAHYLKSQNQTVLLASCDTFRAAAGEQLQIWASRVGVDLVEHAHGADAAAVAFDALKAAQARNVDYLLCDTAGRLHNKAPLMEELKKIARVVQKEIPDAPYESLLVLDATTGQNGFQQAKKFKEILNLSGVVVSKLDGTAKAGVLVSIEKELGVPIKFAGVGEGLEDFAFFSPKEYVEALFEV